MSGGGRGGSGYGGPPRGGYGGSTHVHYGGRDRHVWVHDPYAGTRVRRPYYERRGCFSAAVSAALVLMIIIVGIAASMNSVERRTASYHREALPASAVNETEYIRDDAHWLDNGGVTKISMRYFFKETGVQPYLWITEEINGSRDASWDEIEAAMEEMYRNEFTDEGHLLILFYEPYPEEYKTAYLAGSAAKGVIDDEASQIILDCLDEYYYSDLSENAYFAKVFERSADRIMNVGPNVLLIGILIAGGLLFLVILYLIVTAVIKGRARKRQQDIEILQTDVEKIGGDEASGLAGKYDND
jgi:hypothetical protein